MNNNNSIQLKRGLSKNLPATGIEGEPLYTLDTNRLFIAGADGVLREIGGGSGLPEIVAQGTYVKVTVDKTGRVTAGDTKILPSDVNGLGTAALKNTGSAQGDVPILDTNGKLNSSVIPAVAITETFVVASEAAMLALSAADVGDIAVRTDISKSFILKAKGYATLANWQILLTPTDAVLSVNNKTGTVVLVPTDIGAEPRINNGAGDQYWAGSKTWTNFADATRSSVLTGVSTSNNSPVVGTDTVLSAVGKLQSQTNLRATINSPAFTGSPSAPTPAVGENSGRIATTSYVKSQGYLSSISTIDGGSF